MQYAEGGQNGFQHRLPGQLKYSTMKLSRPLDAKSARSGGGLAAWFTTLGQSGSKTSATRTAAITAYDSAGQQIASWNLLDAYPFRWTGPSSSLTETPLRRRRSSSPTTGSWTHDARQGIHPLDEWRRRAAVRVQPQRVLDLEERRVARNAARAARGRRRCPSSSARSRAILRMKLLFDAWATSADSVTARRRPAHRVAATRRRRRSSQSRPSPPILAFTWGQSAFFDAYLQSVDAQYTMFEPDGTPPPRDRQRRARRGAERAGRPEPDLGLARRAPHRPDRRRRVAALDRLPRVRQRPGPPGAASPSRTRSTTRCASRPGTYNRIPPRERAAQPLMTRSRRVPRRHRPGRPRHPRSTAPRCRCPSTTCWSGSSWTTISASLRKSS